jgi:hypothetical protein
MSIDNIRIEVPSALTIYDVGAVASDWRELLKTSTPQILSLEALNELDAAGFQLLISLAKSLAGKQFSGELVLPQNPELATWLKQQLNAVLEGNRHA